MNVSIRKKSLYLSVIFTAITSLVACGQGDQNQTTPVTHRYGMNPHANCGATDVATDSNGLQLAISVRVIGDTTSNMQSCLVAPPTDSASDSSSGSKSTSTTSDASTATPTTTSTDDGSLAEMSNDSATTVAATTTTVAPKKPVPPVTSPTASDSSADLKSYQTAINNCTPASTELPTGLTKVTSDKLATQNKTGTYQLTNLAFVVNENNTKTNDIGVISAATTGFIAKDSAAGVNPDNVVTCGGWVPGHGKIEAHFMIPNEIRAADMGTKSKRADVLTASIGTVLQTTTLTKNTTPINIAAKRQNLQKLSGPGIETAFYQDSDGKLFVAVTYEKTAGNYHTKATAFGSYTLQAN